MYSKDYSELIGCVFGELTVVSLGKPKIQPSGQKKKTLLCKCSCGQFKEIVCQSILKGKSTSCGHLQFKGLEESRITHDMSKTRVYGIWDQMIQRCNNPKSTSYRNYGGRGITVCSDWLVFDKFWEDIKEIYDDSLTIERIDVNGNYEPSNVTFCDMKLQSFNRRSTPNYSGKTGVTFNKTSKKWIARITKNGVRVCVACCDYLIDAIFARMQAEQEVYGFCKY